MPPLALLTLLSLGGSLCAAETVIVNAASGLASISQDELRNIYLGRKTNWDDGNAIVVVLAEAGPSNTALMGALGKNPSQFSISWKKLVFSGRGAMPTMLKNDQAVMAYVAEHPNAIGYIESAPMIDKIKSVASK